MRTTRILALIRRAFIPTIAAAALALSAASAVPARDVGQRAAGRGIGSHPTVLLPDRVDATAHAVTIRGIGAALLAQSGE